MRRALAVLLLLLGCRNTAPTPAEPAPAPTTVPEPAAVCTKAFELASADLDAKPSAEQREAFRADCLAEAEKEQAQEPAVYACEARCVMAAKTQAELEACSSGCKPATPVHD